MATTTDYLNQLQVDKQALVNNLVEKGVEATVEETFTTLVPKIKDIEVGGGETGNVVINSWDNEGYATEISIKGLTEIPNYYLYSTTNSNQKDFITKNLIKVNLEDTVTNIGAYAFYYNQKLENINFPSNLTTIGQQAFNYCAFKTLNIPSGVTKIENETFRNNISLEEVIFNGNIQSIGSYSFLGCNNLKKISFPNNTTVPTTNTSSVSFMWDTLEIIEVPNALLDDWKASTYWERVVDKIVGI